MLRWRQQLSKGGSEGLRGKGKKEEKKGGKEVGRGREKRRDNMRNERRDKNGSWDVRNERVKTSEKKGSKGV